MDDDAGLAGQVGQSYATTALELGLVGVAALWVRVGFEDVADRRDG